MTKCPSCLEEFAKGNYDALSEHYLAKTEQSDSDHIKFLNHYISKKKLDRKQLETQLHDFFALSGVTVQKWIKKIFVQKFYSSDPHPFVLALQHPSRATLLGYVFEHQHFLRQWVRSCAAILSKTPYMDVSLYEIDNIQTEFGGIPPDIPSHYEYLLRMGESLGINRHQVFKTEPLADTKTALEFWQEQAQHGHWLETLAAMHSLELIAYRNIRDEGASMTYFDPQILKDSDYTDATKKFLREGYAADVTHANEALDLVDKYSTELDMVEQVQAVFIRSIDMFDSYLMARLKRGDDFT